MNLSCKVMLLATLVLSMAAAPATQPTSPFALRGIKGLWWDGLAKYKLALPWVAEHKLNFLMFCYSSFPASGKDWRSDYTSEELAGFKELAAQAQRLDVTLCLSFNPGIWSKPPLVYASDGDYELALKKVRTAHALGIHSFALCLDDINRKLEPADLARFQDLQHAQFYFVNRLWGDMKALSPRPMLIFCPSAYTTRDAEEHLDYIETIGQLDPEILVFWTGPVVCSPTISAADARKFAAWIKRKPFVWDNYPVNDMFPWRPLLAPVRGRSADLAGEVSGFMSNPMKQWHISTIPLATTAAYLNDPAHYDPDSAMATLLQTQRPAVKLLVDLYGSTFLGQKGYPPKPKPEDLAALSRALSDDEALKPIWEDVKPTVEADLAAK